MEITTVIPLVIGLIFTVYIASIVFDESFIVLFDLNKISSPVGRSDYVYTEKGTLINNYRDNVVFPNDKITYKTTLKYQQTEDVTVIPTIKIIQGGKNTTNPIELKSIDFHNKGESRDISQEFFVGNEGHNEIIIEYQIFNSSNNVQLDLARITEQVEVLSLSDKLQSDQNNTLFLGTIASVIIGAVTTLALIFSVHYSKEEVNRFDEQNTFSKEQIRLLGNQNDELKKHNILQNRPWIVINPLKFHLAVLDTREIPWEDYLKNVSADPNFEVPKEVRMIVSCKNVGSSPARVIQYRYRGTEKITLEQLKQKKHSERILLPSQEMTWVANTPYFGQEYFISFLVEYSYDIFDQKGSDFIGTQWRYHNRDYWDIDEWSKE